MTTFRKLCRVLWYKFIDVSEMFAASIFRANIASADRSPIRFFRKNIKVLFIYINVIFFVIIFFPRLAISNLQLLIRAQRTLFERRHKG
jgi:hypothetical protein